MEAIAPWHWGELLAFDLETTGIDPFDDVPVSFAIVRMVGGSVESQDVSLVNPGRPIPPPATAVHGIADELARAEGMPLSAAVAFVAHALIDASRAGVPIVGMKLDFDLTMVDACHRRETGYGLAEAGFTGPVLDALVLDRHFDRFRPGRRTLGDLCSHYGVSIEHAHEAAADARATADVVSAMCGRFPELCAATPSDLHWSQIEWHREWTLSFAEWRLRKGLAPLDSGDGGWPIAAPGGVAQLGRVAG